MAKYSTGGVVSGNGGQSWGGTSIDLSSASDGTDTNSPNTKDGAKPGGTGSSGSKSSSK